MGIEAALTDLLLHNAGVLAEIGTRLYPLVIPQDAQLPAAAWQVISDVPAASHSGSSDYYVTRFQITIAANAYMDAIAAKDAIRACCDCYKGTNAGVKIMAIFIENGIDEFDQEKLSPVRRLDLVIHHGG